MAKTSTERSRARRDRLRKEDGLVRGEFWAFKELHAKIKAYALKKQAESRALQRKRTKEKQE